MDTSLEMEVVQQSALESITKAEVDIQIATAHRFPRSLEQFKKRAMAMATIDREVASACIYKLSRKDKSGEIKIIEGESIRFAEIVASAYGNLRIAAQITEQTPARVTVRAVAHDLENNVLFAQEKMMKTTYKDGRPYSDDMQVIASNALVSKAVRDAVFRVIPKSMVKSIKDAARQVAVGDSSTLVDRRTKAMAWVKSLGIELARVFSILEVKGEADIGLEQLETLIGIHTAIKDGEQSVAEAFPPIGPIDKSNPESPKRGTSTTVAMPKQREPEPEPLKQESVKAPEPHASNLSNEAFTQSMLNAGVDLTSLIDVCELKPNLKANTAAWLNFSDVSDSDAAFIVEHLDVSTPGELKWKTKRAK